MDGSPSMNVVAIEVDSDDVHLRDAKAESLIPTYSAEDTVELQIESQTTGSVEVKT